MKKAFAALAMCFSILLLLFVMTPQPVQGQMLNALTRAMLQAGNFITSGTWTFSGAFYVPSGSSLPATCATTTGASRFFFLTTANSYYQCTATNTWTSIGGLPNPFTNNQTFSGIVNFTGTVGLPRIAVIEVCKSGCAYSTIQSAIDSISDNSASKHYVIQVGLGYWDELLTMKGYVSLRGVSQTGTIIRGDGSTGTTIMIPTSTPEVGVENLTVGGQVPMGWNGSDAGGTTTNSYWTNVILGILDGTENNGKKSQDCWNGSQGGGHSIYARGCLCRTTFDAIVVGPNDTFVGNGNSYEFTGVTVNALRLYAFRSTAMGAQIYEMAASIRGDVSTGQFKGIALDGLTSGSSPTRPTKVFLTNSVVDLTSSGTTEADFLLMGLAATNAHGVEVILDNTSFKFVGSSTPNVFGIKNSVVDADHSTWKIRWNGGRIDITTGGTKTDVSNSDATAGFVIEMSGVEHSGTYSGTAPPTIIDTRSSRFGTSAFMPVADLVVGTCGLGQIAIDSGGATKEWCVCGTANTWGCWKLTDGTFNANGPAD